MLTKRRVWSGSRGSSPNIVVPEQEEVNRGYMCICQDLHDVDVSHLCSIG